MCIQPIEVPLPSRYNPWDIEWSDEEDIIDPLPPAALNTTFIVAADTEEAMELEVVPTRCTTTCRHTIQAPEGGR